MKHDSEDILEGWRPGETAWTIDEIGNVIHGKVDCVMLFRGKVMLCLDDDEDGIDAGYCERSERDLYERELVQAQGRVAQMEAALASMIAAEEDC